MLDPTSRSWFVFSLCVSVAAERNRRRAEALSGEAQEDVETQEL